MGGTGGMEGGDKKICKKDSKELGKKNSRKTARS